MSSTTAGLKLAERCSDRGKQQQKQKQKLAAPAPAPAPAPVGKNYPHRPERANHASIFASTLGVSALTTQLSAISNPSHTPTHPPSHRVAAPFHHASAAVWATFDLQTAHGHPFDAPSGLYYRSGDWSRRRAHHQTYAGESIRASTELTERLSVAYSSCDAGQVEFLSPKPARNGHFHRRDSMTDTFYPATTITGHGHAHASLPPNALAFAQGQRYGAPVVMDSTQEDDGQIACICGYPDDDGMTVACDKCNRWQHTLCYYPQYDGGDLPDELQHFCIDCQPRHIEREAARLRQNRRRDQQHAMTNGAKRPAAKSHKKKVKEPAAYTNGWPMDKIRHDRNSASPRDQPPPAKRPKTSHRNSDTTTGTGAKSHARKRTVTNASHRRSLSRSPDSPIDYYSQEFMRCYLDDQWTVTNANLHNDIRTTNKLSEWLRAPDDLFREQTGHEKTDVLMRWDGELDDIPGKAQIEMHDQHDDTIKDDNGQFPTWKAITVQEPVASGAYIGELRGHVGLKDDYKADPNNRWSLLRHPEPFVFFHPKLPIVIDARNEGTELRFVRRSCQPNATLRILVTDSTDYRFCFMATEQIDPGMEVAVGWDTQDSLPDDCRNTMNGIGNKEIDLLSSWVSNVLANCGPCACQLPPSECAMSRFDRRSAPTGYDDDVQSVKIPKSKKKKTGQHISPLNTHALNSRSGSEARKVDPDDEPTDSRSASGSGGGGSISRDITPNTHYSANGSLSAVPELSERERKKLAKEEEMFRRQEEEQTGSKGKKKRNSAGTSISKTSQLSRASASGSRYTDASTSRHQDLLSARSTTGERPRSSTLQKKPTRIIKVVPRPKPEYANAEVQCDMDQDEADRRTAARAASPTPRRKFVSVTQRLLQRCAENNARMKASRSLNRVISSPKEPDPMDIDAPSVPDDEPPPVSFQRAKVDPDPIPVPNRAPQQPSDDVNMDDAPSSDQPEQKPDLDTPTVDEPTKLGSPATSHPPTDPPAPPWPLNPSPDEAPEVSITAPQHHHHHNKIGDMHLQMPPPPSNPFAGAPPPLSAGITGTSIAQSPASLTPSLSNLGGGGAGLLFSPSVTAAVTPSPARKKLSLSDYTRRSKAKDSTGPCDAKGVGGGAGDRESSPASVASGPAATAASASLQPSSSTLAEVQEHARAADDGGSEAAVVDEVGLEDAPAAAVSAAAGGDGGEN